MKKITIFIISFIFAILLSSGIIYAADISVSGDSVTAYPGDTVKLTISTSGVTSSNKLEALEASVGAVPENVSVTSFASNASGAIEGNNAISYVNASGYDKNITMTLTAKVNDNAKEGSYTIPVSVDVWYGEKEANKTVNATIKVVEKQEEEKKEDKEENKEEDKNTNTDKNNNTSTDKETNKDNNKNTTATVTKSKDAKIKSITAQTSTQNLSVKKSSSKYTTTVAADVNKVTFTVVANSSKATIDSNQTTSGVKLSLNSSSDGKKVYTLSDLKEGGNSVVKITIKAENGNTESYNFVVTRKVAEKTEEIIPNVIDENKEDKEDESEDKKDEDKKDEKEDKEEATLGLKSLVLTGIELSPSFSEDVFEYTAEIINSSSVEVIATPTIEDATVEVVGNEDMVEGENVISILVKSKDEKDVKTYQVLVNKKNETVEAVAGVVDDEEEEEKKGVKLSTEQIIIIVVAVIIGIGVIIGLIVMAKKREEDDYFDWGQDDKNDKKKGKRSK